MSLDFEKPIVELEKRLNQMKDIAARSGKSLDEEAISLENKITELKKEIFSNLTRWQKVQLSRHPNRPYFLDYVYKITDLVIKILPIKKEQIFKMNFPEIYHHTLT